MRHRNLGYAGHVYAAHPEQRDHGRNRGRGLDYGRRSGLGLDGGGRSLNAIGGNLHSRGRSLHGLGGGRGLCRSGGGRGGGGFFHAALRFQQRGERQGELALLAELGYFGLKGEDGGLLRVKDLLFPLYRSEERRVG